jgi:hypothetical protein
MFVINLQGRDVEFCVGFNWLGLCLNGSVCEKADKSSVLIQADCYKTRAWSTSVCNELLLGTV